MADTSGHHFSTPSDTAIITGRARCRTMHCDGSDMPDRFSACWQKIRMLFGGWLIDVTGVCRHLDAQTGAVANNT